MSTAVADSERELVLALLAEHGPLNASGIALACADLRPAFLDRAQLVLDALVAEGKVMHPYPEVWKLARLVK
jgi:hypothetical protein